MTWEDEDDDWEDEDDWEDDDNAEPEYPEPDLEYTTEEPED